MANLSLKSSTAAQYNQYKLGLLITALSTLILGCTQSYPPVSMMNDDNMDNSKAAKERVNYYKKQVKSAQKKVQQNQQKLQEQQQEHARESAALQIHLAMNMLQLGVPIEEVAAATGLPTSHLHSRNKLLREIRASWWLR